MAEVMQLEKTVFSELAAQSTIGALIINRLMNVCLPISDVVTQVHNRYIHRYDPNLRTERLNQIVHEMVEGNELELHQTLDPHKLAYVALTPSWVEAYLKIGGTD